MIFDSLNNFSRYAGLGNNLPAALKFLLENELTALPVGRLELDGDNLYALVREYTTKPAEQGVWEAHRKYIDIQYMVSGSERMGFAQLSTMQLGEYLPERDFQPLSGIGLRRLTLVSDQNHANLFLQRAPSFQTLPD